MFHSHSKQTRYPPHPLGQADDRPHGAAERAAAAEAPAEEPPHVDRQALAQRDVDARDARLELLGGDARVQRGRELSVEAVREPEAAKIIGM